MKIKTKMNLHFVSHLVNTELLILATGAGVSHKIIKMCRLKEDKIPRLRPFTGSFVAVGAPRNHIIF